MWKGTGVKWVRFRCRQDQYVVFLEKVALFLKCLLPHGRTIGFRSGVEHSVEITVSLWLWCYDNHMLMRSWLLPRTAPWRVSDCTRAYRFWPNRENVWFYEVYEWALLIEKAQNCWRITEVGRKYLRWSRIAFKGKKIPLVCATEIRISAGVCYHLPLLSSSGISKVYTLSFLSRRFISESTYQFSNYSLTSTRM